MVDIALQRKNMVESQVRTSDVTDRRIIRAMLAVPREEFVPAAFASLAYMDEHVAVAKGDTREATRHILAPRTLARLIQLLELEDDAVVLDVAAATGYSTAILARIARHVVALEVDPALAQAAQKTLLALGAANVTVKTGDLWQGAAGEGPFDAILINGALPEVPRALLEQLKDGGRLAAIVAKGQVGRAVVYRRIGSSSGSRPIFDAGAPMLPGFARKAAFAL